jgi:hypothetical protein
VAALRTLQRRTGICCGSRLATWANPRPRALEGFRIAAGTVPAGSNPSAGAVADAQGSALAALQRTDLSPERQALVQNVVGPPRAVTWRGR